MKLKRFIFVLAAVAAFVPSCIDEGDFRRSDSGYGSQSFRRVADQERRHVMIYYAAGYNTLNSYLVSDFKDLCEGYIPGDSRSDDVLLVYSHLTDPSDPGSFTSKTSPCLMRIMTDRDGKVIKDTLEVFDPSSNSASSETLAYVLQYAKDHFRAAGYGLVISSHGFGWLPAGFYYSNRPDETAIGKSAPGPMRTLGQMMDGKVSCEMDLKMMGRNIPFKLDYILMDACLMGGIEVAYELKDKCKVLGVSQTEIMAEGFNYKTLTQRLLCPEPDPMAVCMDYFDQYNSPSQPYPHATISLIDCSALEPLAEFCRQFISGHRSAVNSLNGNSVQEYFRYDRHYFYDLEDAVRKAGASQEEIEGIENALSQCILYKAATDTFLSIRIRTYSGLSTYLPSMGNAYLDEYYRSLAWNKAVGLVQ